MREFLSHLAIVGAVAAPTQNQALAALLFLYDRVLREPLPRVDELAMTSVAFFELPGHCLTR